ncbi:MAG: hypothetical protein K0R30_393 [Ornithinibacter sp.]|jgi:hypothetical protein|nr:hypothetical protein [Ornithinibacter sp.]
MGAITASAIAASATRRPTGDHDRGAVDQWRVEWDSSKWRTVGQFEEEDDVLMTVQQLQIAATVLGVVAVILFVLGQSTLGVVFILLAGGAWTLTQYRRAPRGREDDRPSATGR